jgi:hydroxyacylglutathione hydrolase
VAGVSPIIEKFEDGPVWTIGYLVYDAGTREAIVIDVPMWSGERIYERVRELGLSVKYIVATHGHWDHTGEMKKLKSLTAAVVCANKGDEWMMIDPNGMVIAPPEPIEPVKVEIPLVDGSELNVGGITFSVIHTPGHSAGSICLYVADAKILFTGDTLFAGSIGRIDLPTGSMEEISKSIPEKIMTLPEDVMIYPGHGPGSTLKRERMENQFVQMMLAER